MTTYIAKIAPHSKAIAIITSILQVLEQQKAALDEIQAAAKKISAPRVKLIDQAWNNGLRLLEMLSSFPEFKIDSYYAGLWPFSIFSE